MFSLSHVYLCCQRSSTIQRFRTNGADGSGTVWKCSSDAKVCNTQICWSWNIWSYMHFCWIAALIENIILHLAYGCLGNMIQCPLESQIWGWPTVACPASGDFENFTEEQPTQATCCGRGSLCLVPFSALETDISESRHSPHVWVYSLSESQTNNWTRFYSYGVLPSLCLLIQIPAGLTFI